MVFFLIRALSTRFEIVENATRQPLQQRLSAIHKETAAATGGKLGMVDRDLTGRLVRREIIRSSEALYIKVCASKIKQFRV